VTRPWLVTFRDGSTLTGAAIVHTSEGPAVAISRARKLVSTLAADVPRVEAELIRDPDDEAQQ
jgi:hypothetical protein